MIIQIDQRAGFCSGVAMSIQMAEQEAMKQNELYCLGELVHNKEEMKRLTKLCIQFIDYKTFKKLKNKTVLLRSHGEPPETYQIAQQNNLTLVDTTCPIVKILQQKVYASYKELLPKNGQVALYGQKKHPEVIGLMGQTGNHALVVINKKDVQHQVDFTRPVHLFSQTTQSGEGFKTVENSLVQGFKNRGKDPLQMLKSYNTFCQQVNSRAKELRAFALSCDLVIFVAGKNSSNGKVLFDVCKKTNPNTYLVSSAMEIEPEWLENVQKVGISGATSSPMWLMEAVSNKIKEID